MNLAATIKYKKQDEQANMQLKIIVVTIVASIFAILLIHSLNALFICGGLILLEVLIFGRKNGIVNIYVNNGSFELDIGDKNKIESLEKILSYKFRWSYNHIDFVKRDVGTPKSTHVNYLFTRLEITLMDGKRIILGKELNQWNSAPSNWDYEVLIEEGLALLGITSHNLVKLKREMDLLSSNFISQPKSTG